MVALVFQTIQLYKGPLRNIITPLEEKIKTYRQINCFSQECSEALKHKSKEHYFDLEEIVINSSHIGAIILAIRKAKQAQSNIYFVARKKPKCILQLTKIDKIFTTYETLAEYMFK